MIGAWWSETVGEASGEILDRLHLTDLYRREILASGPPSRVADQAHQHLQTLSGWRLLLASWALGRRSVDEDPLAPGPEAPAAGVRRGLPRRAERRLDRAVAAELRRAMDDEHLRAIAWAGVVGHLQGLASVALSRMASGGEVSDMLTAIAHHDAQAMVAERLAQCGSAQEAE